ncbi:hypothetical protein A8L44_04585 [Bacillus sp. FJAT-27986]|nr:hypothetical protein A8L44_04585 [Bacillus sp. FJAT-27986]
MKELENSNRLFVVPIIAILILGIIFMTAVLPMVKMETYSLAMKSLIVYSVVLLRVLFVALILVWISII